MELNNIQIKPRLRSCWEAIDLGFILARHWYKPLFLSWAIPSFALLIPLTILFHFMDWVLWVPGLIVWWLKPLWDSGPLQIGSRALFGEQVPVLQAIKGNWQFIKPDWLSWLTWRRFSPVRSIVLPVTGLERLSGKERSRRIGLLTQGSGRHGIWLTLSCLLIEGIFFISVYVLVFLMLPESMDIPFSTIINDESTISSIAEDLITLGAAAVIAPFYTMAGFALYINRRIELEAWDIEIRFRDLAARQSSPPKPRSSTATTIITGILVSLLYFSMPQQAEASTSSQVSPELSRELIDEVLQDEAFHNQVTESGWRLKERDGIQWPEWLTSVIEWIWNNIILAIKDAQPTLANLIKIIIYLCSAVALIWLIYHYRQGIRSVFSSLPKIKGKKAEKPKVLFGLDVQQDTLPDNVPAEAVRLWDQGHIRSAIGLLYRATLSELIHSHSFHFHPGNTERECAALVAERTDILQPLNSYVQNLTEQWQLLAYAHRPPPRKAFEYLCQNWQEVFKQ